MVLREIRVHGIRNLRTQRIVFPKRITVIHGQNGQGKTSLLEAIYLLSQSRSFRTSQLKEVLAKGEADEGSLGEKAAAKTATVVGILQGQLGEREIELHIERGRRTLLLDGKKADSAASLFGQLRCVTFTPEELQLVKGAPQIRRQFIDRTLSQVSPEYLIHLVHYQRALKQRNSLLVASASARELGPWEEILVEHGMAIVRARQEFLVGLSEYATSYYKFFCDGSEAAQAESLSLKYKGSYCLEAGDLLSAEAILQLYAENRSGDLRLKSTQIGVHRDDMEVEFHAERVWGKARVLCSQGQARTIALSLKLASVEFMKSRTDDDAVLLLDDVESELDAFRRGALFRYLNSSSNQILITTTDPSWALHREASLGGDIHSLRVEDGLFSAE